jgi:ABC-2 type transport system ATP-binding protein
MPPFLIINNISKNFDKKRALNGLSFSVEQGKIFGLLGPNGAGKTTLIRIINRIFEADEGQVLFNGREISAEDVAKIGYLPEERGLFPKMKVGEQILFFAKLKGMNKADAEKQSIIWLKRLGAYGWIDKKVTELSKGMQQKIQFIITVLHNPKLLILDEPFTGFDPINVDLIKKQILKLRDDGATIIFSTHNMASVEEICEQIVLINNGQNILEGEINNIKKQFFTNTYMIEYQDVTTDFETNPPFEIIQKHEEKSSVKYTVNLQNTTQNDFFNFALSKGKIISYNPVVPSLHDIFVNVVNKSNINN